MSKLNNLLFDSYGFFISSTNHQIVKFNVTREMVNCINDAISKKNSGSNESEFRYSLQKTQPMKILSEEDILPSHLDYISDQLFCKETDSCISILKVDENQFPDFMANDCTEVDDQDFSVHFEPHEGLMTVYAIIEFDKFCTDDYVVFSIDCQHLEGVISLTHYLNENESILKKIITK